METQTEMPILSYGDTYKHQSLLFDDANTNRTFLFNIRSGDKEGKWLV